MASAGEDLIKRIHESIKQNGVPAISVIEEGGNHAVFSDNGSPVQMRR
jgi:hypothetical protein